MVLLWYEYVLIAAIFATILTLTVWIAFSLSRVRVQKWIGGAIGNFMTSLAKQAAEEEGGSSPGSSTGALELGGFKIDPSMIKTFMELYKMAKDLGIIGPGGLLGGAGSGGGGGSSGKIGL